MKIGFVVIYLLFIGVANAAITIQSQLCNMITPKININCSGVYDKCVYIPHVSNFYISETNMCEYGYTLKAGYTYHCCKKNSKIF